jgi:hypothetical protein
LKAPPGFVFLDFDVNIHFQISTYVLHHYEDDSLWNVVWAPQASMGVEAGDAGGQDVMEPETPVGGEAATAASPPAYGGAEGVVV